MKSLSCVRLFATLWTVSIGFSRQEYWSGLLLPSPGDLPDPEIEPRSPALQADAFPSEPPGKSILYLGFLNFYWYPIVFFPGSQPAYYLTFKHHVSWDSSWLWQFLRRFLFLMTLTILRNTGRIFCRTLLSGNLSEYFLMIRLGPWVFGMTITEKSAIFITSYQGYILSTWFVKFVRFVRSKITNSSPPAFPYCIVWKEVTTHISSQGDCHHRLRNYRCLRVSFIGFIHVAVWCRNAELCYISLRMEDLHNLFGILLLRGLLVLPIYSCIYVSIGLWIGAGNGTPLQYSCLENPMDRGAWWAPVHGVAKSQTRLSDFTFTFHFHALEKETATHSSVLAWRIPGKEEPGGLPSMGSHGVGHDWGDLAAAAGLWIFIFNSGL